MAGFLVTFVCFFILLVMMRVAITRSWERELRCWNFG